MVPRKKERAKEENQAEIEGLREELEALRREKDELLEKLHRVAADYDNYQKRAARQIAEATAHEKETLIKALLPVLDNFEHVLVNADNVEDVEAFAKGVQIVYEHTLGVLAGQGVEQIKALGEKFDPAVHEAIVQQSDDTKEDSIVLGELQRGYKLNGRVIRASRVIVNKTRTEEQPIDEEAETKDTE